MFTAYPACFIKDGGGYAVFFPDLDYVGTCGDTLDDAFLMAMDLLAGQLTILREEGEPVPPPSPPEAVTYDAVAKHLALEPEPETPEHLIAMVTVDAEEYADSHFGEQMKTTVTLPMALFHQAVDADLDLSLLLQNAIEQALAQNPSINKND